MEKLFVVFDWDQALIANNMVIRPICDDLFLNQLAKGARAAGDELDALILENLHRDSARHNRWTMALAKFAIEENSTNRVELRRIAMKWHATAEEIVEAGSQLISSYVSGLSADAIAQDVRRNSAQLHSQAGLGGDA
jgi:toluene monooxygenase system protein E